MAGGYLAATGPADYGAQLTATLLPGGAWRRFGLRASVRSLEQEQGLFLLGATFEAAASRPRLALEIFGEAGMTEGRDVVVGGGIHNTLWVVGPLALGGEGAAHFVARGLESSLALSAVLVLGLAR